MTCTDQVVQLLRCHGQDFERSLLGDRELQETSKQALEDTDSNQPWFSRVTSHLKGVIEKYFAVDDDGNSRFILCSVSF